MIPDNLIKYINQPEKLNDRSIYELTLLVDKYPYFQSAQLLRIKNLHNLASDSIKPALNFTAAYVTDRKVLYYLLHPVKEIAKLSVEKSPVKDVKESMKENIADTLTNQLEYSNTNPESEIEFISSINVIKEYGEGVELNEYVVRISEDGSELMELICEEKADTLVKKLKKPGKPEKDLLLLINKGDASGIEFDNSGNLSENQKIHNNLIDSFINTNPKLIPDANSGENEDISKDAVKESEHYITETLAQIYFKQGNYAKSIFAYEKLSLKYPEKSTYFAVQIAEIKQNIDKIK